MLRQVSRRLLLAVGIRHHRNRNLGVQALSLPTDYDARKAIPIFDGFLMYFPDACAEVAVVSRIGNEQHNPGEPLHWARGKSMDQFNTAVRHLMDHGVGVRYDSDGGRHLAKAAWRVLAALQLDIEKEQACQAATTSNTKKPTKSSPRSSKSGRSATRRDTPWNVRVKYTKGTELTSTTFILYRVGDRILLPTGAYGVVTRTGVKAT